MSLDASSRKFQEKWSPAIEKFGFTMIPNVLLDSAFDLGLTTHQLMILIVLERYRWELNGDVFPSYATIGAQSGISGRTVERQVKILVEDGHIGVEHRQGYTNYFLLDPIVQLLDEIARDRRRQNVTGHPRHFVMGPGDMPSYDKDSGARPP